jgi:hypothetical protein
MRLLRLIGFLVGDNLLIGINLLVRIDLLVIDEFVVRFGLLRDVAPFVLFFRTA